MFNIKNPFKNTWKEKLVSLLPKKRHYLAATLVVVFVLGLFYTYQIVDAFRNAYQIQMLASELKAAAKNKDWAESEKILKSINANIDELNGSLNRLFPITDLPVIKKDVFAIRNLLASANVTTLSGLEILQWVKDVPLLSANAENSFSKFTPEEQVDLLAKIAESKSLWRNIQDQMSLALSFAQTAKASSHIPIVSRLTNDVASQLTRGQQLFAQIQPWLSIIPSVAGYPAEKTYLLLLQNNTELRPTGGFIGTYGILKLKNGEVSQFTTDNVYNLDEPAKAYITKIPPEPLQKYIKQSQWFLRDVNWDPDFPATAQNAIQFYKDEKGPIRKFDGVIAFTPDMIEDIMSVLGTVTVDGKDFTAENLIDTLAYHVELGFKEEGITIYNRKQIIDDLAQQLKDKLFNLSLEELKALVPVIFKNLDKRSLMFYFADKDAQKIIEASHWAGKILDFKGDYLYVVDANLGSLKSDPAVERTISYNLTPQADGTLLAIASINYNHTGNFNWKTTRYRTYTRIYIPLGSKLVAVNGNEEPIAISDEHDKTVFGTFISIEPGFKEDLTFTYTLPQNLTQLIAQGNYELLLQKQPGASSHTVNLDIALPFKADSITPPAVFSKSSGGHIIGNWDLPKDRIISIKQKP